MHAASLQLFLSERFEVRFGLFAAFLLQTYDRVHPSMIPQPTKRKSSELKR
jgi:hypothetical protein